MSDRDKPQQTDALPENGQEALTVLRGLWSAQGQSSRDVAETAGCESTQGCKATNSVTFDGLIDEMAAATDGDEPIDSVQTAWRKKLEQDGKLKPDGKRLRDVVLGDAGADKA